MKLYSFFKFSFDIECFFINIQRESPVFAHIICFDIWNNNTHVFPLFLELKFSFNKIWSKDLYIFFIKEKLFCVNFEYINSSSILFFKFNLSLIYVSSKVKILFI